MNVCPAAGLVDVVELVELVLTELEVELVDVVELVELVLTELEVELVEVEDVVDVRVGGVVTK
jgi:hypothetical protein